MRGRVQGVGFRWWVQRAGLALRLSGNVWNRPDGSVELQVSGPTEQLRALEKALWSGPPSSRVDLVEEIPASGAIPENDFLVEGR